MWSIVSKAANESRSTNTQSWRAVNRSQNVVYHTEQDRIRRVVFPIRRLHSGHQIVRFKIVVRLYAVHLYW